MTKTSDSSTGWRCSTILNQETCLSALLYRHHHLARVEVNAGSYGSSRVLSRLGDIKMLTAPRSISALTRCMLPCIFRTRTSWMICAESGLCVPHRYWLHIRAQPSRVTLDFKAIRCGCISSKVANMDLWSPLPQRVHCRFAFRLS